MTHTDPQQLDAYWDTLASCGVDVLALFDKHFVGLVERVPGLEDLRDRLARKYPGLAARGARDGEVRDEHGPGDLSASVAGAADEGNALEGHGHPRSVTGSRSVGQEAAAPADLSYAVSIVAEGAGVAYLKAAQDLSDYAVEHGTPELCDLVRAVIGAVTVDVKHVPSERGES